MGTIADEVLLGRLRKEAAARTAELAGLRASLDALASDFEEKLEKLAARSRATLKGKTTESDALISTIQRVLTTATSALAERIDTLTARVASGESVSSATVEEFRRSFATSEAALAEMGTSLIATFDNFRASYNATVTTLATQDFVEAKATETLTAASDDATAQIDAERIVRVGAEGVIANAVDILEAAVAHPITGLPAAHARITTEEGVRAGAVDDLEDDIAAVASRTSTLESQVQTSGSGLLSRVTTVEGAYVNATSATAIANSRIAAALTGPTGSIYAAVTVEQSARISGDNAINANLATRWGVSLDVNGRVVGRIRLDGGASSSSLEFTSDAILLSHPSAPGVLFNTTSRVSRAGDTRSFIAATGFGFNHAPAVRLVGSANPSAGSYDPRHRLCMRGGVITIQVISRIIGANSNHTVYYQKNGGGALVPIGAFSSVDGATMVLTRSFDAFSGLAASDYFDFYVAPCDGNGDIPIATPALTTEIDVLAFNW